MEDMKMFFLLDDLPLPYLFVLLFSNFYLFYLRY